MSKKNSTKNYHFSSLIIIDKGLFLGSSKQCFLDYAFCFVMHYRMLLFGCLIQFFTSQSTIFQLCLDGSSLVEPVLSKDKCVLLKDTTQWRQWGSNPLPLGLESSTLPLSPKLQNAENWLINTDSRPGSSYITIGESWKFPKSRTLKIQNFAYQCCLLITFANSLHPNQVRQYVGPDLGANSLTL